MQRLISAELVNQIALVRKHLPGIHNQKLHGKPVAGPVAQRGAQDPRVGKFPNDALSPLRHEVHIQRVITGLRTEAYPTRNKKIMTRKVPAYGYAWSDTHDNVTGADLNLARIISRKIGSSVDNVRISRNQNVDLLATWTDKLGKMQSLYSVEHNIKSSLQKFVRLAQFELVRDKFLDTVNKDVDSKNIKTKECARALYMINRTSFMPGDDKDADRDTRPTFGATTLRNRHVSIERQEANHRDATLFNFVTKEGKTVLRSVPENKLARLMKEQKGTRGPNEKIFPNIKSEDVAKYMSVASGGYTPKDIRTYNATYKALQLVSRQPYKCSTVVEFKSKQNHIADLVGKHLSISSRAVLRSYIDPQVWNQWRQPHWGPWVPPGLRVAKDV